MKEAVGNLWDFHEQGKWIVITTNGSVNMAGYAVMGRGSEVLIEEVVC